MPCLYNKKPAPQGTGLLPRYHPSFPIAPGHLCRAHPNARYARAPDNGGRPRRSLLPCLHDTALCFDRLSMSGCLPPLTLSLSKGERNTQGVRCAAREGSSAGRLGPPSTSRGSLAVRSPPTRLRQRLSVTASLLERPNKVKSPWAPRRVPRAEGPWQLDGTALPY